MTLSPGDKVCNTVTSQLGSICVLSSTQTTTLRGCEHVSAGHKKNQVKSCRPHTVASFHTFFVLLAVLSARTEKVGSDGASEPGVFDFVILMGAPASGKSLSPALWYNFLIIP